MEESVGIQQLSAADERAVKKIDEAKKRILRRLKQDKEKAQDEIKKYTEEKEKQFKELEIKHMGSREDFVARMDADIKIKMNKALIVTKQAVIDQIFELIYDVTLELLNNFKAIANEE